MLPLHYATGPDISHADKMYLLTIPNSSVTIYFFIVGIYSTIIFSEYLK